MEMNLILIRNGYPLTPIRQDDRLRYYDALAQAVEDFGMLEQTTYRYYKHKSSNRKVWCFRLTLRAGFHSMRFLFFFDQVSSALKRALGQDQVTLHVAGETKKFFYTRLSDLPTERYPELSEIGYNAQTQRLFTMTTSTTTGDLSLDQNLERVVREFIAQVFQRSLTSSIEKPND